MTLRGETGESVDLLRKFWVACAATRARPIGVAGCAVRHGAAEAEGGNGVYEGEGGDLVGAIYGVSSDGGSAC
jgi:hypothetical protein